MSLYDAEIGDIVIANETANSYYAVTKEGWMGIITDIDTFRGSFKAKDINGTESFGSLSFMCFDLCPLTAQRLAKELRL